MVIGHGIKKQNTQLRLLVLKWFYVIYLLSEHNCNFLVKTIHWEKKPNSHLKIIINILSLSMKQGPMIVLETTATKISNRRFNGYCVAFAPPISRMDMPLHGGCEKPKNNDLLV